MEIDPVRHPLLYLVSQEAQWGDAFPAFPEWADECERWLKFLETAEQFNRFLPRLWLEAKRRDETFA